MIHEQSLKALPYRLASALWELKHGNNRPISQILFDLGVGTIGDSMCNRVFFARIRKEIATWETAGQSVMRFSTIHRASSVIADVTERTDAVGSASLGGSAYDAD